YSVGFTDQMYFSKVFKKLRGQTPTEFRRKNNGRYM
ncbi:MAG: AraC family transcriptional regulator, partial [Ruminococcus sp.]